MKHSHGLALIPVLISLLIISLSTTSAFELLALEQSLAKNYKSSWQLQEQSSMALRLCEKNLLARPVAQVLGEHYSRIIPNDEVFDVTAAPLGLAVSEVNGSGQAYCTVVFRQKEVLRLTQLDPSRIIQASIYATAIDDTGERYSVKADYYLR